MARRWLLLATSLLTLMTSEATLVSGGLQMNDRVWKRLQRVAESPDVNGEVIRDIVGLLRDGGRKNLFEHDWHREEAKKIRNKMADLKDEQNALETLINATNEILDFAYTDPDRYNCGTEGFEIIAKSLLKYSCDRCSFGYYNMACRLHDNCYSCQRTQSFCDQTFARNLYEGHAHCHGNFMCSKMADMMVYAVQKLGYLAYGGKDGINCLSELPDYISGRFSKFPGNGGRRKSAFELDFDVPTRNQPSQ